MTQIRWSGTKKKDQCHIVIGLVFVVRVVMLFESGAITGKIYDSLQYVEIINSPGI